ncbi:hypothetical protein PCASD_24880 [Puccinia coronata f. sp. avenae]|uniref:Uncharacterized protein n=1 Tax=Puccinia coronata f. sp. avenae TaxID=200324 RepID=A0A2N5TWC2_9BASI|nr:hypothetical protein PCASD_24880 [Puccinia coronata f. sp. avenae]
MFIKADKTTGLETNSVKGGSLKPVIKGCTLMTGSLLVIEVQTLMTDIEPVIQETPNGRFNTSPQGLYLDDQ